MFLINWYVAFKGYLNNDGAAPALVATSVRERHQPKARQPQQSPKYLTQIPGNIASKGDGDETKIEKRKY